MKVIVVICTCERRRWYVLTCVYPSKKYPTNLTFYYFIVLRSFGVCFDEKAFCEWRGGGGGGISISPADEGTTSISSRRVLSPGKNTMTYTTPIHWLVHFRPSLLLLWKNLDCFSPKTENIPLTHHQRFQHNTTDTFQRKKTTSYHRRHNQNEMRECSTYSTNTYVCVSVYSLCA